MQIKNGPKGMLLIDNARIIFRNFAGARTKFNNEGNRNFALVIDDKESADMLIKEGWNVKIKPPRDEDDTPLMFLPVKIHVNDRGPNFYLTSGDKRVELIPSNNPDEDMVANLDNIDILNVDLDIRPFDWEVNGKTGRTAYLHSIHVTQDVDRFRSRFED